MGEKDALVRLWDQLGNGDVRKWRDDSIFRPLADGNVLVYSMDRPAFIFETGIRKTDLELFGRWCAGMVANDVIACGVRPVGISFDVGTGTLAEDELLVWARGVQQVCGLYGMKYEGGNLGVGSDVVGMCYGFAHPDKVIRRRGAQPGDVIIATAMMGTGWALEYWRNQRPGVDFPFKEFDSYKHKPWVNIAAFAEVWELGAITCGMDLSDGIIEFGYEILEQSGLSAIFNPSIQYSVAVQTTARECGVPESAFLFEPGYDMPMGHGWCVNRSLLESVISVLDAHSVPYLIVGYVEDGRGGPQMEYDGRRVSLPRYWDDVYSNRGSIEHWSRVILPLFGYAAASR